MTHGLWKQRFDSTHDLAVPEISCSIPLMIQAKIIRFWIDSWFNPEAFSSLLTWEVANPFVFILFTVSADPVVRFVKDSNFVWIDSSQFLQKLNRLNLWLKQFIQTGIEFNAWFQQKLFDSESTHDSTHNRLHVWRKHGMLFNDHAFETVGSISRKKQENTGNTVINQIPVSSQARASLGFYTKWCFFQSNQ